MKPPHPENLQERVAYYVGRLDGPDAENAFHALIEEPGEVVPLLVDAYRREVRAAVKAALVEVVSEIRDPAAVSFLVAVVREDGEEMWKRALDGLVTLGGASVLEALGREERGLADASPKKAWIREALDQIREASASSSEE